MTKTKTVKRQFIMQYAIRWNDYIDMHKSFYITVKQMNMGLRLGPASISRMWAPGSSSFQTLHGEYV